MDGVTNDFMHSVRVLDSFVDVYALQFTIHKITSQLEAYLKLNWF